MAIHDRPELSHLRVVVVDELANPLADRRWGYWSQRPIAGLSDDSMWSTLILRDDERSVRVQLPPGGPRYRRLHGRTVERELAKALHAPDTSAAALTRVRGHVTGISDVGTDAVVTLADGSRITAALVLDSAIGLLPVADGPHLSFVGGVVALSPQADIHTGAVTLMDFRVPQRHGLRFVYILPLGEGGAFVEMTSFVGSGVDIDPGDEERELRAWAIRVGAQSDEFPITERGQYPLRLKGSRWRSRRVLAIGRRSGLARPSTGYAATAIAAEAKTLAEDLATSGWPAPMPPWSRRDAWMDAVVLELLQRSPAQLRRAYLRMFERVPPDAALRFLSGHAPWADAWAVVRSMPLLPFALAGSRIIVHSWTPLSSRATARKR